jgi:HAE1 family hydrophobic/amphiphilic exporter-1
LVPGGFIPEEDMGYFFVNIQLPDASLQRTALFLRRLKKVELLSKTS